jgi:cytochrome c-type biogenesis protein CcmF
MEIIYTGEHLIWGNLGHFGAVLAMCAALLASFSFFKASAEESLDKLSWYKLGRVAFWIHSLAVLTIIIALFGIIYNHYFEYYYAWRHSSTTLPVQYMVSCFWEGQEGSFLLWMFWHMVIGNILLWSVNKWTSPVMSMIALCQFALASMLVGIHVLGYKVGSSPFELLRLSKDMADAPIFGQADYLAKIYARDGNGLNPLLQNYWMVIHPPILFFGFATTIVPFAYAIAGLWKKNYTEWLKPALPWALISVMVLGTGIIMGGMWAYESLNFGGYWAWDPVENASLIPWLILIAGVHTMLINKATGHSLKSTYILITGTFLLVLYATFLTRSGVLGNTSVHSFTDLGLSGQLLVFLFIFVIVTLVLLIINWKNIPSNKTEQQMMSREFWMFIGAMVLILSAIQIAFTTSFPVFNKVLGTNLAPPTNVIQHYNNIQLPIAIILALLAAVTQYFKYKITERRKFFKGIAILALIALILTIGAAILFELSNVFYLSLLFSSIFSITANFSYIFTVLKGKMNFSGASVAHVGFGLMLVGILVSSAGKNVISLNNSGAQFFDTASNEGKRNNFENILLLKNRSVFMGDYQVTYRGDSVVEPNHYYKVDYTRFDSSSLKVTEQFRLYPNMQINPKMGNVYNPATRHYATYDVFTHVTAVPDKKGAEENQEWHNPEELRLKVGDTIITANNSMVVLENIKNNEKVQDVEGANLNMMLTAQIKVITLDKTYTAEPIFAVENNRIKLSEYIIEDLGMRFLFKKLDPSKAKAEVELEITYKAEQADYIIMKAIEFPYINLLWGGTIIMVVGFLLSITRRIKEYRKARLF